jgi:hypothetical protein
MSLRCLFLAEGSSDAGLAVHIQRIAVDARTDLSISTPELGRLREPPGRRVESKLRSAIELTGDHPLIIVHRDANSAGADVRRREIGDAIAATSPRSAYVAVVPVRMTESWLLLDEALIREVAGNPRGSARLDLPSPARAESISDPKALLRDSLLAASETTGRRRKIVRARFGEQRRQLLERLDPDGPVREVPSWRRFVDDVRTAVLAGGGPT